MPDNKWVGIRNAFDPYSPVPPGLLEEWFVVRPDSPVEGLVREFSPESLSARHILVGQPSSGKSSELTKLAAELRRRYSSIVVQMDLSDNLDIVRVNPAETIFLMGAALFKVASQELPPECGPDRAPLEDLRSGLETIVRKHTENEGFCIDLNRVLDGLVVFGGAALAGPAGATAGMVAAKAMEKIKPFRFSSGTSIEVVSQVETEPDVETMVEALNGLVDDVRIRADRHLVFLVDGLDKLREPATIALNFLEREFLNGPACNVLYTGPLDLYYSPSFGEVRARFHILPFTHVKLRDRDDPSKRVRKYCAVMKQLLARRVAIFDLSTEDVITRVALTMLIDGSAGVMRDFVRLVRVAALRAEVNGVDRIGKREAVEALNEMRRQLKGQLTPDYDRVLSMVRESHNRTGGEDAEKCDMLLRNGVVLAYVNKDVWYDVHAALTDEPW